MFLDNYKGTLMSQLGGGKKDQVHIAQKKESIERHDLSKDNRKLLDSLVRELCNKFNGSVLEYADILLESFMYPNRVETGLLSFETIDTYGPSYKENVHLVSDLENSSILDVIHIRELLRESLQLRKAAYSVHVENLEKIHVCFVMLLRNLSAYLEIPNAFEFFKHILQENICNFEKLFQLYKQLKHILHTLIQSAFGYHLDTTSSYHNDDVLFQISHDDLLLIKDYSLNNNEWLHDLLYTSNAYQDFCKQFNRDEGLKFEQYIIQRKELLNISTRSL